MILRWSLKYILAIQQRQKVKPETQALFSDLPNTTPVISQLANATS